MGYGYRDMCHPQIHRISMEYPSISIFGFIDSPFDMVAQLHGLCLWEDTVLLMDKILHQVLTVSYGKSPIYNAVSEFQSMFEKPIISEIIRSIVHTMQLTKHNKNIQELR